MSQQLAPPSSAMRRTAIIVTGGAPLAPAAVRDLPHERVIIAADSGLDHALAAGLRPDLVVGDLDSVSAAGVAWARANGVPIEVFPTDKDYTDTELALEAALTRGLVDVVMLSGGGDRLDHSISAITALGHPAMGKCKRIEARWGAAQIFVLHAPGYWELALPVDTTFSLLALHGECTRVTLTGARWPLNDAEIRPGSSLSISNEVTTQPQCLTVGSGILTVIAADQFRVDTTDPLAPAVRPGDLS